MSPADSGSVLLAGFLKELERSKCISLKTVPGSGSRLWVAGIYSCLVVVLCCVCRGLGVVWGFQVVPVLCYLGTFYLPSPMLWLLALQPPHPAARMARCVRGIGGPPQKLTLEVASTLCLLMACSWQDLKCLSLGFCLITPRKFILWLPECPGPAPTSGPRAKGEAEDRDRPVSPHPSGPQNRQPGSRRLLPSHPLCICFPLKCLSFYCPSWSWGSAVAPASLVLATRLILRCSYWFLRRPPGEVSLALGPA